MVSVSALHSKISNNLFHLPSNIIYTMLIAEMRHLVPHTNLNNKDEKKQEIMQ